MCRRIPTFLRCALAVCVLTGAVRMSAEEPAPAAPSPAATLTPSEAVTPTVPPGSPAMAGTPAPTPKLLYPSTSMSSLLGSPSGGGSAGVPGLGTTFLVLLGLCAGGYYLTRRHPAFAANFKGTARKLMVNESRSLGNRQFLVVVEYENERMLLGVTPGKIDYLCPLRGPHGEPGAFPPIREGGA